MRRIAYDDHSARLAVPPIQRRHLEERPDVARLLICHHSINDTPRRRSVFLVAALIKRDLSIFVLLKLVKIFAALLWEGGLNSRHDDVGLRVFGDEEDGAWFALDRGVALVVLVRPGHLRARDVGEDTRRSGVIWLNIRGDVLAHSAVDAIGGDEKGGVLGCAIDRKVHTVFILRQDALEARLVLNPHPSLGQHSFHLIQQDTPPKPVIAEAVEARIRADDFFDSLITIILEGAVVRNIAFVLNSLVESKAVQCAKAIGTEYYAGMDGFGVRWSGFVDGDWNASLRE